MTMEMPPLVKRTLPNIWAAAVARAPHSVFLLFAGDEYTYGAANQFVQATRQQFERDGVTVGAHVAVFLDNSPDYLWTLLALSHMGAVAVPIHAEARGQLLTHFLLSSECSMGVIADKYAARVHESIGPDVLKQAWIVTSGDEVEGPVPTIAGAQRPITFGNDVDPNHRSDTAPPRFCDATLLMFTSGTSGPSKAAVCVQAHPVTAALHMAEAAGIVADDRMHTCLPLSHANAMWFTTWAAITAGASVALTRRFSVRGFWRDIVDSGATQTSLLGSMLQLLWKREHSPEEDVKRVKSMFVVPFPTNPQEYEDRFGTKLMTLYGMSEWTPISLSRPGEGYDKAAGMAGPLRRDLNDIAILDDDDLELPVGAVGEIAVRRKEPWTTFQGYYARLEETLSEFRNLWFHTGDHGYIGEDDYLYFVGRKSDSLRRRGENISAGELEDLLLACDAVGEVAAVAVPSDLGDISEDDIAIFVIPSGADASPRQVLDYARAKLPRYMAPRYIKFVDELPRTSTEKIRKSELRRVATASTADFFDAEHDGAQ
jgi:crotonobetaine/carnitine-CoA ligase